MYLLISNNGEIDPRAFSLLGASSKRNESESIGFFGSGAKYALAVLLREGKAFRVFSGEREIVFTVKRETFRDKEVSIIHIDGQPTSLTVETGPKWTLEHAIRELYSNALDEENGQWAQVEYVLNAPNRTAIYIEVDEEIQAFWDEREKFFIGKDVKSLWEVGSTKCYDPASTGSISNFFRRGVWCCEDRENEPIYSYDLHNISLNESRVASSYDCMMAGLGVDLRSLKDNEFIENFITQHSHKECAEWYALHYAYNDASLWKFIFEQHWQYVAVKDDLGRFPEKLQHKVKVVSRYAFGFFKSIGIGTINTWMNDQEPYEVMSWPVGPIKDRVERIAARLIDNGLNCKWPIKYGRFQDETVMAMADFKKNCIILGKLAVALGDDELTRTLIEEHVHLDKKVRDNTREQQNAYIDIIVSLLK